MMVMKTIVAGSHGCVRHCNRGSRKGSSLTHDELAVQFSPRLKQQRRIEDCKLLDWLERENKLSAATFRVAR